MNKMNTTGDDSPNYSLSGNRNISHLDSGLPQWLITIGFIIMAIAAVCTVSVLDQWFREHSPLALACINNVGMLIMYYATMRGMKSLYRPLTWLWWLVIVLNVASFISICLGSKWPEVDFIMACALPLAYLPLGLLIANWYNGRLQQLGIWMIVRIFTLMLLPIAWFMLSLDMENPIMQGAIVLIELIYAWQFYRLLRQQA